MVTIIEPVIEAVFIFQRFEYLFKILMSGKYSSTISFLFKYDICVFLKINHKKIQFNSLIFQSFQESLQYLQHLLQVTDPKVAVPC